MLAIRKSSCLARCLRVSVSVSKRYKVNAVINHERITDVAKICNVSLDNAHFLMKKNEKLNTCDLKPVKKLVEVMKNLNIDMENIHKHPKIVTSHTGAVKNRYLILRELGFKNVTMAHLATYNDIMQTNVASTDLSCDPIKSICKNVKGLRNLEKLIATNYKEVKESDKTLKWLHRVVLLEYLIWKLKLKKEEVFQLVAKYRTLANSSITNQKEIIDMLINNYNFTVTKIKSNGFLLLLPLESVDELVAENPTVAGVEIRDFVHIFPRFLSLDSVNVKRIKEHVEKFKLTNDQLLVCGNIYSLNSDTLLRRLETIAGYPELMNFKSSHRFLFLVYYFDSALDRLRVIKEYKINNFTLDAIISERYFKQTIMDHVKREKIEEFCEFLAKEFEFNAKKVREQLDGRFVDWCEVELRDVKETVGFLCENFGRDEIVKVLSIVLYDVNLVRNVVEDVKFAKLEGDKINLKIVRRLAFLWKKELEDEKSISDTKYGKKVDSKSLTIDGYLNPQRKEREKYRN